MAAEQESEHAVVKALTPLPRRDRKLQPVVDFPSANTASAERQVSEGQPEHDAVESRLLQQFNPSMTAAARTLPLLVCSIGNPGAAYANTLHSAGHTVITALAEHLGYASFTKDRQLGNGAASKPPATSGSGAWTLWQSTAYMNESGKGVRAAFLAWIMTIPGGEGRLVIVHDELEKPLGAVTVRTAQGASAKGHNGLKSIMSTMGGTPFTRIGIGIGRPISRDSNDVARYVLKKMTPAEKLKIEASVEEVVTTLKQLEKP